MPRVKFPPPPELGALVRDITIDRVGVVMDVCGNNVYLRPQGGGVEWTALPEELEPADRYDELRARVGELNTNSRWRRVP
jgi:hypothetical protein